MKNVTTVSFPSLGIEPFSMNKIAFSIGSIEVRWYGIVITLGIVLAFVYAWWRGKRNEGVILDDVIDIGLWTVILGVLGARLYYVLTTLDEFEYNNLIDVIALWNGGLAIYGGIIGGCIGILIACRIKKICWRRAFDMIGPGVMIAQALGRWGNFFNGEAYGYAIGETTRFYFFNTEHLLPSGEGTLFHTLRMGLTNPWYGTTQYYHPTFFYECIWNLIGFGLINLFYKHKKFDGQIALMYFTWYGFGRMFIEGFRTDSLHIPGTTLRISQCLGLACFLIGLTLLLVFTFVRPCRRLAERTLTAASATVPATSVDNVIAESETESEAVATDDKTVDSETQENQSITDHETTESEDTENGKID